MQGGRGLLQTGLDVSRIPPGCCSPFHHTYAQFLTKMLGQADARGAAAQLPGWGANPSLMATSSSKSHSALAIPGTSAVVVTHPPGMAGSTGTHLAELPASPSGGLILHRVGNAAAWGRPGIFPTVPK